MHNDTLTSRRQFISRAARAGLVVTVAATGVAGCGGGGGGGGTGPGAPSGSPAAPPNVPLPPLPPLRTVLQAIAAFNASAFAQGLGVRASLAAGDVPTNISDTGAAARSVFANLQFITENGQVLTAANLGLDLATVQRELADLIRSGGRLQEITYTIGGRTLTTLAVLDANGRVLFDPIMSCLFGLTSVTQTGTNRGSGSFVTASQVKTNFNLATNVIQYRLRLNVYLNGQNPSASTAELILLDVSPAAATPFIRIINANIGGNAITAASPLPGEVQRFNIPSNRIQVDPRSGCVTARINVVVSYRPTLGMQGGGQAICTRAEQLEVTVCPPTGSGGGG